MFNNKRAIALAISGEAVIHHDVQSHNKFCASAFTDFFSRQVRFHWRFSIFGWRH